jgi:hypothetical protein
MTAAPIAPDVLDKILLMLANGLPKETILAAAIAKLGLSEEQAACGVQQARTQLTLAARYDLDEERGTAITALRDCYAQARAIADIKTALAARRELNKLLSLYAKAPRLVEPTAAPSREGEETAAARRHLEPLGLGGPETPLAELCRRAVLKILEGNRRG